MKNLLRLIKENPILDVAIVGIVLPLATKNGYFTHVLVMSIMFAILASSLNITLGLIGLSNLAQATFFGVGAFVAAILNSRFQVPFYITLVAGGLVTAVFGLILGAPTLRLKGVFLALATSAFGNAMRILEINWVSLTNGPMGITGIGPAVVGGWKFSDTAYIYYGLALLLLCMYITKRIRKSKIGRAFLAIKSDRTLARSMGVRIASYKVGAYVLSACLAGMAGTIYAHYAAFISPDSFTMADSTKVLCMVVLGGAGSLLGPVVGAVVLTIVPEILRFTQLYQVIFFGVLMVVGTIAKERNWSAIVSDKLSQMFHFSKTKAVEDVGNGGGAQWH